MLFTALQKKIDPILYLVTHCICTRTHGKGVTLIAVYMKSAYFFLTLVETRLHISGCNTQCCMKFTLGPVKCPPCDLVKFLIKRVKELAQFGNDRGVYLWMDASLASRQALVKDNVKSQAVKPSGGIEI